MTPGIVSGFVPPFQRVTVTVIRTGGSDPKGNPLPEQRIPVPGCLPGWRTTSDPIDMSDLTDDDARLFIDVTAPEFLSTDRVEIPPNNGPSGVWRVDGTPQRWPLGVEIMLTRNAR